MADHPRERGIIDWWEHFPLYLRILAAVILGVLLGISVRPMTTALGINTEAALKVLDAPGQIILQMLKVLAAPLVLVAVVQALMKADLPKGSAGRLVSLLVLNTLVAIVIGGLMFMFGEGGAKRQISGIVFGGGLALFAAQFLVWLF